LSEEGGSFTKNITVFNMKNALQEIVEIQDDKAKMKGITITIIHRGFEEDEVYRGHAGFAVKTDMKRMQQVTLNLLSNAIKFTDRQGHIRIMFEKQTNTKTNKPELRVSVSDDGLGIQREDQSKLFKLFASLQQSDRNVNPQGIGLGLVICRMIVKKFNGFIDFESEY
jgi:signal transduction histidine kinase